MSKILAVKINPDPISIIFGSSKDIKKLMPPQRQFVAYGLLIAKKLVLLFWKDKETPALKMWITNLMDTLTLKESDLQSIISRKILIRSGILWFPT